MSSPNSACLKVGCKRKVVSCGIECDICGRWAHPKCSGLKNRVFKLYEREADLIWVCQPCRDRFRSKATAPSSDTPIADISGHSASDSEDEFDDCMSAIVAVDPPQTEDPSDHGTEVHSRISGIEAKLDRMATQLQAVVDKARAHETGINRSLSQLSSSVNAVTGRNKNLLILNAPERTARMAKQRRRQEAALVHTILRAANVPPGTQWQRAHRLGRWEASNMVNP